MAKKKTEKKPAKTPKRRAAALKPKVAAAKTKPAGAAFAAGDVKPPFIHIRGARQHNLKNITLDIPRGVLTVVTGVSGSGKSSLAFDTLFAEGQRRFVESQSTYARQFLQRLDKPDVDAIEGLCPAIAVRSRNTARSARSTVGTVTEITDYLRLVFSKVGVLHCPQCEREVRGLAVDEIAADALKRFAGRKVLVLAPLSTSERVNPRLLRELVRARGYSYVRVKKHVYDLETCADEELAAALVLADPEVDAAPEAAQVFVVVDRVAVDSGKRGRLVDSLETALKEGVGFCVVAGEDGKEKHYSQRAVCGACGIGVERPTPQRLSFNNPLGACPACTGFGDRYVLDWKAIVPDQSKTLRQGAIEPFNSSGVRRYAQRMWALPHDDIGIRVDAPFRDLNAEERRRLLHGYKKLYGIQEYFNRLKEKSYKASNRFLLRRYRTLQRCPECKGSRLNREALSVRIGGKSIADVMDMPLSDAAAFFGGLEFDKAGSKIVRIPLGEINSRLRYLVEIGLGYLTLNRPSRTLSGGEMQRIHLAGFLGSRLMGAMYILDEPTVGLHPRDTDRLMRVLSDIRDTGNTVIVVEHDLQVMRGADFIVDMGPGAGEAGGAVVFSGPFSAFERNAESLTAAYLRGDRTVAVEGRLHLEAEPDEWLTVRGARENNLKNVTVRFPLRRFSSVTGVSGSGKSSLVCDVLHPWLAVSIQGEELRVGACDGIDGWKKLTGVEMVGQDPIGRTPRANPASYMDILAPLRALFAGTRAAKERGFGPGMFSFNVSGGRCETCEGAGVQMIEMQFLADVYVVCDACNGKRYHEEVLEVRFRDRNISEMLDLTVTEALTLMRDIRPIVKKLHTLDDVGLGYLRLGQPLNTLSGGEAQRLKIARELVQAGHEHKLFLFDEPTMGLHPNEVGRFLKCVDQLVRRGHTVIVIEHNPDVIAASEYVVDLGPEGGGAGGEVVAVGTPKEIAANPRSLTGRYLEGLV